MLFTHEHEELQRQLKKFIDAEINPFVDEWEEAEIFPAHEVFKKMGQLGFLGVCKPEEYGGHALDYSYSVAMAEALGHIQCGGIPMAIGVQTDMATPALARFGTDELRREFLAPSIAGDFVACLGVSAVFHRFAHAEEAELPHLLEYFVRREYLGFFPFVDERIDFRVDEFLQLPLQLFVLVGE